MQDEATTEIVYTTTLADGVQSIVTRVTVVPGQQATPTTRSPGSGTNGNASLQTNDASSSHQYGWPAGAGLLAAVVAGVL